MVRSVYVHAAIITLVVLLIWFGVVSYIELTRGRVIEQELQEFGLTLDSDRVMLLYFNEAKDQNQACTVLQVRIVEQLNKIPKLLNRLAEIGASEISHDVYWKYKQRFLVSHAELLYYVKKSNEWCQYHDIDPILFFYKETESCLDCDAQGAILNVIRDQCKNIRVFAFPIDTDVEVANLLKNENKIVHAPSIVVDGNAFEGIQSKNDILARVSCTSK